MIKKQPSSLIRKQEFEDWNNLKWKLQEKQTEIYFKQWEIWWISLWQNIQTESFGKGESFRRPVLILKKLSEENCIVIPLSTKIKKWSWFYNYKFHWKEATALLYQIKMIHKNRLQRKLWKMETADFKEIKKKLSKLLNL